MTVAILPPAWLSGYESLILNWKDLKIYGLLGLEGEGGGVSDWATKNK